MPNIALIPGDGIGPEIVNAAVRVLRAVSPSFCFETVPAGGCAIDLTGVPLPESTVRVCLESDSVLLGAVGGPAWDGIAPEFRPERALLGLRSAMQLFTNLRPARLSPALRASCMLRDDLAQDGIDLLIVRELTGGIYFGEHGRRTGRNGPEAFDTEAYSVKEIERITRVACQCARRRRHHVTSVDKANVLETSRLWRETVHRIASEEYPDVTVTDMLVDNCAMQLIRRPSQFDVLLTSNLFGDILSDEASQLTGSIGLLPSASLGSSRRGLYEPIHGSAPDLAGKNLANPIGTILSAAMMLRYSLDMPQDADRIESAVDQVLKAGYRTADIASDTGESVSCSEMTDLILSALQDIN